MTPAGTSNELDVQNEWEENTHTFVVFVAVRSVSKPPLEKKHNFFFYFSPRSRVEKFANLIERNLSENSDTLQIISWAVKTYQ